MVNGADWTLCNASYSLKVRAPSEEFDGSGMPGHTGNSWLSTTPLLFALDICNAPPSLFSVIFRDNWRGFFSPI